MRYSSIFLFAALAIASFAAGACSAGARASAPVAASSGGVPSNSALEPLTIVTASGAHRFKVEVEITKAQLERGLMFRRFLPTDRGMLFDFQKTQPVLMWMKNTYIPLDMIFISKDGKVAHIARDAQPLSETIIPSGPPVFAVLEVNGGVARRIGLKVGDRVENALFGDAGG